jgi:hypothetical protein
MVKVCTIIMDEMETKVNLKILPLGYYDLLRGMDWLEKNSTIVNSRNKTFNHFNEFGKGIKIKGILCGGLVNNISALQLKRNARKGCEIYGVHISESKD